MSRSHFRRLTSVVSAAFLGLMLLGSGVATAAQPAWSANVNTIPGDGQVAPGALAGYTVTITNGPNARSIITGLNMDTDLTADSPNGGVPKYVGAVSYLNPGTGSGSCSPANTTRLMCTFGSLQVGQSVRVTVALQTPTTGNCTVDGVSAWCFNFRAFGNGNTPADGGTSHGDYLLIPARIKLNGSANFAGGFFLNGTTIQTNQALGRSNQQATTVTPPAGFENNALTVEDGSGAALDCTTPSGAKVFGECSSVDVGEGTNYAPSLIKITILIYGGAVPRGVALADIYVIHTRDDGTTETLPSCTFTGTSTTPDNPACFKVTKVGANYKVEIWTPQNGGYRGGYN